MCETASTYQDRTNPHDSRCQTCNGSTDILRKDGLAELESLGSPHEQDSCSAVRDLTAITGGTSISVLAEGRFELRKRFVRRAPSRAFVFGDSGTVTLAVEIDSDGHDLVIKPACPLGNFSSSIRLYCISVLLLTADVEVMGDVL